MDPEEGARTRLRQELLEDRVVAHIREVQLRGRRAVVADMLLANSVGPMRKAGLALKQLQETGR